MKIRNRTEYGVRALVLLAERQGEGPLSRDPEDAFACCTRIDRCRTRHVWVKMTDSIAAALRQVTLEELIQAT